MATSFLKKSTSSGALNAMEGDGFEYSLGPPESGFSLFLAERTKKVHFIRHAEVRIQICQQLYFIKFICIRHHLMCIFIFIGIPQCCNQRNWRQRLLTPRKRSSLCSPTIRFSPHRKRYRAIGRFETLPSHKAIRIQDLHGI